MGPAAPWLLWFASYHLRRLLDRALRVSGQTAENLLTVKRGYF